MNYLHQHMHQAEYIAYLKRKIKQLEGELDEYFVQLSKIENDIVSADEQLDYFIRELENEERELERE